MHPTYLQTALYGLPVNVNSLRETSLNSFSELLIRKPWWMGTFAKNRKYIFPVTVPNKASDTDDIKFIFIRITSTLKALQEIRSVTDFSCGVSEDRMPYTIGSGHACRSSELSFMKLQHHCVWRFSCASEWSTEWKSHINSEMLAEEHSYRFGKRKSEAKLNYKQQTLKWKWQKYTQRKTEWNSVGIYQCITLTKGGMANFLRETQNAFQFLDTQITPIYKRSET